jgi:hypothetical protein
MHAKHALHARSRAWLDRAKPGGWAVAAETTGELRLRGAAGHQQVRDLWPVQIASEQGWMLASNDAGLASAWPDVVEHIG